MYKGKDAAPGKVLQDVAALHARESEKAVAEQVAHNARISSLEPVPPSPLPQPTDNRPPAPKPTMPPTKLPPPRVAAKSLSELIKTTPKASEPAKKK